MDFRKLAVVLTVAVALAAFFYFDVTQYLTLEWLQGQQRDLAEFRDEHWLVTLLSTR